ncbi:MAG: hypothetical protein WKF73_19195 [Nocardioidaceae bacterium]
MAEWLKAFAPLMALALGMMPATLVAFERDSGMIDLFAPACLIAGALAVFVVIRSFLLGSSKDLY